ncbi:MAG: hypothetical protein GTN36_05220 [Candidatus Aenigmarchaeota archaeon]|nr:hypothetical protein [Candidatus Aenigmarchaeota archaeon]
MLENLSDIIGILATVIGIITSVGFYLQTFRIIRRKSSADVSVKAFSLFSIGIFTWFVYGISLNNLPLIISNIVALIGTLSVIITYFKYKK